MQDFIQIWTTNLTYRCDARPLYHRVAHAPGLVSRRAPQKPAGKFLWTTSTGILLRYTQCWTCNVDCFVVNTASAATPGTQEQLRRASHGVIQIKFPTRNRWWGSAKEGLLLWCGGSKLAFHYHYLQFAALVSPPTRRALTSSYH